MFNKQRKTIFVALIVALCLLFNAIPFTANSANAIDYDAESRVLGFMGSIAEAKGIEYDKAKIHYSTEMYDEENNVIAQATIIKRNGIIDYGVYNYITENIDEYGFDCPEITETFPKNKNMYYAGTLNYFTEEGSELVSVSTGKKVKKNEALKHVKKYKEKTKKKKNMYVAAGGSDKNGYEAFINWEDIDNEVGSWENTDYNYLDGVSQGMPIENGNQYIQDGVYGGLSFKAMSNPLLVNVTNHCGPMAITNMMVYYDWLGMNTLLNDSWVDTFNRVRTLSGHTDTLITMNDARDAAWKYLREMGYSSTFNMFYDGYNSFKNAIDDGKMVITVLVVASINNPWGHFVLVLGYEEFRQENTSNYKRYLRICDGWSTCNDNRYIELNDYFDWIESSAFTIQ